MSHDATSPVEYRPVAGCPGYRVGSDGTVWSCWLRISPNVDGRCVGSRYSLSDQWRELRYSKNRTGYLRAAIYSGGIQRKRMVHLLVLEAFVGPCPEGMEACHRNDHKDDAQLANLRWDTPKANWEDRRRNGRANNARGDSHPHAKLTEAMVATILASPCEPGRSLAAKYGVRESAISAVRHRRTWKHVKTAEENPNSKRGHSPRAPR